MWFGLFVCLVYQPPRIIVPPEPITVLEGEPFSLNCIVQGKPTPQIKWSNNGQLLGEEGVTLQVCSKLQVQRAYIGQHDGKIIVKASNEAGEAMQEVDVIGENYYKIITD